MSLFLFIVSLLTPAVQAIGLSLGLGGVTLETILFLRSSGASSTETNDHTNDLTTLLTNVGMWLFFVAVLVFSGIQYSSYGAGFLRTPPIVMLWLLTLVIVVVRFAVRKDFISTFIGMSLQVGTWYALSLLYTTINTQLYRVIQLKYYLLGYFVVLVLAFAVTNAITRRNELRELRRLATQQASV